MKNMPTLTVGDIMLRTPEADDLEHLFHLTEPATVRAFLGSFTPTMEDSFARLLRNAGCWALYGTGTFIAIHQPTGKLVGTLGMFHSYRGLGADFDNQVEAGWIIAEPFWGQGLATQLMRAILAWFDQTHGVKRTVCMIEEGHGASDAIARKLGYQPYRTATFPGSETRMQLYERTP